jgi:hypothetical protein
MGATAEKVQIIQISRKLFLLLVPFLLIPAIAVAHGVAGQDADFLRHNAGQDVAVFMYLGAKHMVTGYDHLLFLFGVIFFLYRLRDVAVYVTLFALGHSITLLLGVLFNLGINSYLVDAIIGFSIVYKAWDNIGGFGHSRLAPNPKLAVLAFGLCHGLGLASKLQAIGLAAQGLVVNMIAFNVGVELGQFFALVFMLLLMTIWRQYSTFERYAFATNIVLMVSGFLLVIYQLAGALWSNT